MVLASVQSAREVASRGKVTLQVGLRSGGSDGEIAWIAQGAQCGASTTEEGSGRRDPVRVQGRAAPPEVCRPRGWWPARDLSATATRVQETDLPWEPQGGEQQATA